MIREVALVIDNELFYFFLLIALILIFERRNEKRVRIFSAVVLGGLLGLSLKEYFAVPRPCAPACDGYSFPSVHASGAFALMAGFIRKRSFPFFLLFALFVSWTRIYLNVHTLEDIIAALPVGLISYYIVWRVDQWRKRS